MYTNNIEVSVLMTAYNHGKYIEKAVRSALTQKTDFEYEVIVGEDCSPFPDKSREILTELKYEFGERLILVFQEHNVGCRENSKCLKRLARGKYLCALECDDYWTSENKLQMQYDFLEKHPEYSACGSDNITVDDDGNCIASSELCLKKDRTFTLKDYRKYGFTVHGNTLMRRAEILSMNDPKYIELLKTGNTMGDIYTFSLLYAYGPIYVFHDKLLAHRDGSKVPSSFSATNRTRLFDYTYMQIDMSKALNKYFDDKLDFEFIAVNRIAEILFIKNFSESISVDKADIKKLYDYVGARTVLKARIAFIRKFFRRIRIHLFRKFYHDEEVVQND